MSSSLVLAPRPLARLPSVRCLDGRRTPAARAEGSAGSARGKGGMRRPPPRQVVSRVVSRDRGAPSGKELGKASRPLTGKRVPRQAAVARPERLGCGGWGRPGPRAGEGIPKGPPLGAGPGRREPRHRKCSRRATSPWQHGITSLAAARRALYELKCFAAKFSAYRVGDRLKWKKISLSSSLWRQRD